MNFVTVGFVDTSRAVAGYINKFSGHLKEGDDWPLPCLPVKLKGNDEPVLSEWKSLRNLLILLRGEYSGALKKPNAAIENAFLFSLPPKTRLDWLEPPQVNLNWLFVPLIMAPGIMLYSGVEAHCPATGVVTGVTRHQPFSAINVGKYTPVFLVADATVPE